MSKRLFYPAIALVSILFLGYIFFFRTSPVNKVVATQSVAVDQELDSFLTERMDYGLPFSMKVAYKHIARAKQIAVEYPQFDILAAKVVDTLNARLARKAKM